MSQGKENITPGFSASGFLPALPELRVFSLILLIFAFGFSGNLQDRSLLYLQYVLILLPLIHMESRAENEAGKKRFYLGPYFLFIGTYVISWFWMRYPDLIPAGFSTGLYVAVVVLIVICFFRIFQDLKGFFVEETSGEQSNVLILSVLLLAALILSGLKIFKTWPVGFEDQYSMSRGFFTVVFLTIIFLAREVIRSIRPAGNHLRGEEKDENTILEEEEMAELAVVVETVLQEGDLFLQPSLSLADLSRETGIPSYKLSHLFNQHFEKGFYQILGEYRIRYAMRVMDENHNISFDVLAEMCGFNSRSTFYKYFRMINFCTPKEYLRTLEKDAAVTGAEP